MDWSSTRSRGRRRLVLGFVCFVFAGLGGAPAFGAEQAFVDGNGVVQVVGDAGNDDIHFSDGGHPPNGHDVGTEIWDTTTAVAPGNGCIPATDDSNSDHTNPIYCGSSQVNSIHIDAGAGDDHVRDEEGPDESFLEGTYNAPLTDVVVDDGPGDDVTGLDADAVTHNGAVVPGSWTVNGGDGNDTISGTNDSPGQGEHLNGDGGDDHITGGENNDVIHGGDGNDTLDGQFKNDAVFGDAGNDTVIGGEDDDILDGGPGRDSIVGDSSDLTVTGNDRINAVDGEQDSVSCGLGADLVNADAIDVVSAGDCEQVHRTSSGHFTAAPTAHAFPRVCHTVHRRRICHAAAPVPGRTYHGRTSAGRKVTLKVDRRGRIVAYDIARVDVTCPTSANTFNITDNTGRPHIRVNGTFADRSTFADSSQQIGSGRFFVVGAFSGRKAAGMVVVNAVSGGEKCTSGRIRWTATG